MEEILKNIATFILGITGLAAFIVLIVMFWKEVFNYLRG
jgi:hypothetical protein